MKAIKDDYLLNTSTARALYRHVDLLPIIDYHCHLSPQEIYEDKKFDNIAQVWLGGDHYKWRLMRAAGVPEEFITGDGDDKEKFRLWATTIGRAIGNPLYEWSHLELLNYFGYDGLLNEDTWERVWELANKKLENFSARELIAMSNVEVICTTDDPVDDLRFHKFMAEDDTMPCKVYPTWRPDKAVDIEKDSWSDYIKALSECSGIEINSFSDLKDALIKRMDYFGAHGCVISDHGLAFVPDKEIGDYEIEHIFKEKVTGENLRPDEIEEFKFALLTFLGREYSRRGWAMQLHYGVKRNNSSRLFDSLGADVGGDNIGESASVSKLANFLDALDKTNELPKTIIYSLNPSDNAAIDTICASFQEGPTVVKVQHGSAWWVNDSFDGMTDQIKSFAAQGYLAGFIGMLTDSRSFMSYARHEYFRRVLARQLGSWVEDGRFPKDEETLKSIMEDICYYNAKKYFGFE